MKYRYIYRSSKTGHFVTKAYAMKHKATTQKQRVLVKP